MAEGAVINAVCAQKITPFLMCRNAGCSDRFDISREFAGPVWNHFKTRLFPLHPAAAVNID
jgi:hypothetical protein